MGKPRWWSLKPIMVAFRDHPCVCRRASLSCCVLGNRTLSSFTGWDNTSPEWVSQRLTYLTMFKAPFIHPGFDRSHLSLSLTSKPPSALFSHCHRTQPFPMVTVWAPHSASADEKPAVVITILHHHIRTWAHSVCFCLTPNPSEYA